MALKAPDMDKCTPKRKCLGGPNDGIAYDPRDPCPAGSIFNSSLCDCDLLVPFGSYIIYYRQESGGPTRCAEPHGAVCRRRCYSVQFDDVQNIKTFSASTSNSMCCRAGCGASTVFSYNFVIEGEGFDGTPKFASAGYWYEPGGPYFNNTIEGTYTNIWTVTGIKNVDTGEFIYGYDCSNDPDLCGGGHPNGECTGC